MTYSVRLRFRAAATGQYRPRTHAFQTSAPAVPALVTTISTCLCVCGGRAPAALADRAAAGARSGWKTLVGRLDLEKYKATSKGLTQFGDRRQGTDRNRAAVDWIEAQLKSYGCPTERIKYVYDPPPPTAGGGRGRGNTGLAVGGGRPRGDEDRRPASTPIR